MHQYGYIHKAIIKKLFDFYGEFRRVFFVEFRITITLKISRVKLRRVLEYDDD